MNDTPKKYKIIKHPDGHCSWRQDDHIDDKTYVAMGRIVRDAEPEEVLLIEIIRQSSERLRGLMSEGFT